MADVIGILTGLIGACDVTIKATRSLTKFISEFKNAPKETVKLKIELENLEAVIGALQGYLRSSKAKQQPLLGSSPVGRAIQQCRDYVDNLSDALANNNQKSLDRSRWAFKNKDRCLEIIGEINRYTNLFHLALSLDGWELFFRSSLETTKALRQVQNDLQRVVDVIRPIGDMRNDLAEWEDHLRVIREAIVFSSAVPTTADPTADAINDLDRKEKIFDFITKVKLEPKHRDIARVRHANTCLWIQKCNSFQKWLGGEAAPCLWIHGTPGCGKTIMLSFIVDHLKEERACPDMVIIPTYFTHQDPTLHDVESTFQAILRYAASSLYGKEGVHEVLYRLRENCQQAQQRLPNLRECCDALENLSQLGSTLVLCFDGVDELPDVSQQRLLTRLGALEKIPEIKVIISSRSSLNLRSISHVELPMSANEDDLRLYLNNTVADIMDEIAADMAVPPPDGLKQEIVDRIIEKSNGMFLLATLQARQLRSASSLREVLERSHGLPEEIDGQYSMYLDRVKSQPRSKLALKAIQWVSCAYRPLQVQELVEALSVRSGDSNLDPTGMTAVEKIVQAAGGLLVLDTDSNIIRLVHDSLRDYLYRNQSKALGMPHLSILATLATYLDFQAFDNKQGRIISENWLEIELLKSNHKLLDYACRCWNHHLRSINSSEQHTGLRVANRIAASSTLLRITTSIRLGSAVSGLTPFHIAMLWEDPTLASEIVSKFTTSPSLVPPRDKGPTPLHLAARFNNVACAKLSVKVCSDIWAEDQAGTTPLHTAALYGSEAVLACLLGIVAKLDDLDAIINHPDQRGWTPLHSALSNSHLTCAMQLLAHGANPNARTLSGKTAVHLAIDSCPLGLDALLKAGATFTGLTKTGRSALHIACASGNIDEDLRSVLQTIDPNTQDQDGVAPLHELVRSKTPNTAIVKWLIELGADPNVQDKDGLSPLHSSLSKQDYQIAEYLLRQGARIDCESSDGTLPSLIGISQENCPPELLDKLLDTDLFAGSSNVESLLHRAVRRQKPNEVSGLLRCGANVNRRNSKGATPLHIAVSLAPAQTRHSTINPQRSNIISLLLQASADPHADSHSRYTPIHIAVIRDSSSILRQLLSASDSIERSRYLPDKVPLLAFAAVHSSPSCFKLLFRAAHKGGHGKLKAGHLVDIIQPLLDYAGGIYTESDLTNRIQTYETKIGLPLSQRSVD
ncbi:ankyrin repeat-containing domain protein [Nemania abortiva]|nr:ankyrin repeat-containing domain protein [Nemania abortiva]